MSLARALGSIRAPPPPGLTLALSAHNWGLEGEGAGSLAFPGNRPRGTCPRRGLPLRLTPGSDPAGGGSGRKAAREMEVRPPRRGYLRTRGEGEPRRLDCFPRGGVKGLPAHQGPLALGTYAMAEAAGAANGGAPRPWPANGGAAAEAAAGMGGAWAGLATPPPLLGSTCSTNPRRCPSLPTLPSHLGPSVSHHLPPHPASFGLFCPGNQLPACTWLGWGGRRGGGSHCWGVSTALLPLAWPRNLCRHACACTRPCCNSVQAHALVRASPVFPAMPCAAYTPAQLEHVLARPVSGKPVTHARAYHVPNTHPTRVSRTLLCRSVCDTACATAQVYSPQMQGRACVSVAGLGLA